MHVAQVVCLIFSYIVCLSIGCFIGCSDPERTPNYWTALGITFALMILFLVGAYY